MNLLVEKAWHVPCEWLASDEEERSTVCRACLEPITSSPIRRSPKKFDTLLSIQAARQQSAARAHRILPTFDRLNAVPRRGTVCTSTTFYAPTGVGHAADSGATFLSNAANPPCSRKRAREEETQLVARRRGGPAMTAGQLRAKDEAIGATRWTTSLLQEQLLAPCAARPRQVRCQPTWTKRGTRTTPSLSSPTTTTMKTSTMTTRGWCRRRRVPLLRRAVVLLCRHRAVRRGITKAGSPMAGDWRGEHTRRSARCWREWPAVYIFLPLEASSTLCVHVCHNILGFFLCLSLCLCQCAYLLQLPVQVRSASCCFMFALL
jgi:hypothetical protein